MPTKDKPISYWMALARLGFEEDLARIMEKKDMKRADLAAAMEVKPPFVTKILGGANNYQLQTLAKIARGVGAVLEIRLADEGSEVVRVVDIATAGRLDDQSAHQGRISGAPEGALRALLFWPNPGAAAEYADLTDDPQTTTTSGLAGAGNG